MDQARTQEFWIKHKKKTFEAYKNEQTSLPHRYVLVLTNLCNLRCSFCFQARKKRPEAMTKDQWLDFIDQIPDGSRLTLTGGEPLVFKGFEDFDMSHKMQKSMLFYGPKLIEKICNFYIDFCIHFGSISTSKSTKNSIKTIRKTCYKTNPKKR